MLDVRDLLAIASAREAGISPDGGSVAFAVKGVDSAADRETSELRLVELRAGGEQRVLLDSLAGSAPSWAPDGRSIAFLRDGENGGCELRLLDVGAGADRLLAVFPAAAAGLAWSPDGARLALGASPTPGGPQRIAVVGVADGAVEWIAAGRAGEEDSVPAWSPDGERLAFGRTSAGRAGEGPLGAIWTWPVAGGEPDRLATDLAFACCPSWSPDGERLACAGTAAARLGWTDPCLQAWVFPAGGGPARLAAEGVSGVVLSPSPAAPVWASGGSALYFREARSGEINVVRAELGAAGPVQALTGGCQVVDFSVNRDGVLAFTATNPRDPGSVRLISPGTDGERPLAASRGGWTEERAGLVPTPARRAFRSPHGERLDGWLQGLRPGAPPQPLLVAMHGGPHGFFGPGFQLGHFYRNVLAARGWLVLALNSSGSGSYGEAFAEAIRGRWGERDLPEHLAAVEELVERGWADPDRLAVAGYSYGGYLAAWAVCAEDRFKAAVVGAPIANLESFERTSDIGNWYTPWEMRGGLPENAARYRRLSPVTHADRIAAPVLLLHGDADRRCPPGQSEELRERIAAAGRSRVELVEFEGADHLFYSSGRPSQRLEFNRRIVEWLETAVPAGRDDARG